MAKTAALAQTDENSLATRVKSWPQQVKSFYVDVRTEMKKVSAPSRKEVTATTAVVIITVFIFGAYFMIVDKVMDLSVGGILKMFR